MAWKNLTNFRLDIDGDTIERELPSDVILPEAQAGIRFIVDKDNLITNNHFKQAQDRDDIFILNYALDEISNSRESFSVEVS